MALSQFLLSASLLVLGTPPLHHHFPHPGPVCAEHRLGFALSPEVSAGSEIGESWLLDGMAIGFADVLIQHEAPTVVLLEAGPSSFDLSRQLFSSDVPPSWTPVRYGPLTVEVRLVTMAEMVESLEHVHLLLDNRPLEPRRHALPAEPPRMLENGLLQVTYRYSLPCPPPGRHILQARYKLAGVWSHLSMPLRFDVRLPEPPQIIAISDGDGHPVPIRSGQMLSITSPSLKLQLAQVNHNVRLVAYLNDKPVIVPNPESSCCRTVPLEGHITPGVHRLTVRTIHVDGNCTITSEPSNEVVFHYYDEDVYLLSPSRKCNHRQNSAHDSCKPAKTALEWDENTLPAARASELDVPSITAPDNASRGNSKNIFRHVAFATVLADEEGNDDEERHADGEGGDDREGDDNEDDVDDDDGGQADVPDRAQQLLDTAIRLREVAVDATSTAEKAAEEAGGQAGRANWASLEAETARGAAIAAREKALSTRNEVYQLVMEADAYWAPAAAEARKQLQHEWRTVEEKLREAIAMADVACEQSVTAADQARQAKHVSALVDNAFKAAQASKSKADKTVQEARTTASGSAASDARDAVLTALDRLRSSLTRSKDMAIEQRDRAQRLVRTAITHRETAEEAKTAADEAKQRAEEALRDVEAAVHHARAHAIAARDSHTKDLPEGLDRAQAEAGMAAEQAKESREQSYRARDAAAYHESGALKHRAAAGVLKQRIDDETDKAKEAAAQAEQYARELAGRGDSVVARVARRGADDAAGTRDALMECSEQAARDFQAVMDLASETTKAARQAADRSQQAEQAAARALSARTMTLGMKAETEQLLKEDAKHQAAIRALAAKEYADQARVAAAAAEQHALAADSAAQRAAAAHGKTQAAKERIEDLLNSAKEQALSAETAAMAAGRTQRLESQATEAWELAITRSEHQRLEQREAEAEEFSEQPADVRLAEFDARAAEKRAEAEETKSDFRIQRVQAEARQERAVAITGPPSPFYFAAPAHFPIRGFGAGGEVIERPGAVIYEDMVFSFDAMGNYNLRFSILVPELPTTLHLQLQIQPEPGRPWHTITLPPQHFRPDASRDSSIQPKLIRDYIVEGRSEILHRCYGQMGQDATIRRAGSARFGYGFDAMRQAARN
jgi:hypothetical protein